MFLYVRENGLKNNTPHREMGQQTQIARERTQQTQKAEVILMEENKNVSVEQEANQQSAQNEQGNEEAEITVDTLMAQLAQERAEKEKNKAALDKVLKEKGEITKQLRARQTAEEQEAEAKREQQEQHEAYVKGLERQIQLTEAINRYTTMGMDAELAKKTAEAELEGTPEGKDLIFENIKKMTEAQIKAAEAEWLKNRPDVQAGNDEDGEKTDPFLKGFDM